MLWQLLRAYVIQAWPFALGHVLLMVYLFKKRATILREADALRRFRPKQTQARSAVERVFEDYIAECEQWLPRGVLAPMSDYTARLEAWLGTQVGNARGAVNLLLVVGIAGTFFALFSFAGEASRAASQREIARSLTYALSYAFPVGFIGLLLNMIGHLIVSDAEGRLRDGLQAATSAVLRYSRDLAATAKTPSEHIIDALEPLRRLDQSVGQALAQVLEQLTSGLLQEQMQALEKVLAEVRGAVDALRGSIQTMSPTLQQIGELQRNATENLQALAAAGDSLAKVPRYLNVEVAHAMEKFAGTIQRTEDSFRESLTGLRDASTTGWNQAVDTLRQSFANQAAGDIRRISEASEQALQKLVSAAYKLDQNADAMKAVIRDLFQSTENAIRERLAELYSILGEQYPQALDRLQVTIDGTTRAHTAFQRTLEQMEAAEARWRGIQAEAQQMLDNIAASSMASVSNDVREIREQMVMERQNTWSRRFRKRFGGWLG